MDFDKNVSLPQGDEEALQIGDLIRLCLAKWYWFVLVGLGVMAATVYGVKRTPPVYQARAEVLIKSQEQSSFGRLEGIGFSMPRVSTVQNEVNVMSSTSVLAAVVRDLGLQTEYYRDGMFYPRLLYGSKQFVKVEFIDLNPQQGARLTVVFHGENRLTLKDFDSREVDVFQARVHVEGLLQDTLATPVGRVVVHPTPYYYPLTTNIYVHRTPMDLRVNHLAGKLTVGQSAKQTTILALGYRDIHPQRAEDILAKVIDAYSEEWIKDRAQSTLSTSAFIAERLGLLEQELGAVDLRISAYRSTHLVQDPEGAAHTYLSQISATQAQRKTLEDQVQMARHLRNSLTQAFGTQQFLPANTGLTQANIDGLIEEYNTKMMERNVLLANSSERNPLVQDADKALEGLRGIILHSVDNALQVLQTRTETARQREKEAEHKMSRAPAQSQYLLSAERQQSVKADLYLFLLQKREENEISQAFTSHNTRIISAPFASSVPIAPKPKQIYALAALASVLSTVAGLFFVEMSYSRVRGRADLHRLSVPFLAEIPQQRGRGYGPKAVRKNRKKSLVVRPHCRDSINEAFRVLRTNLAFVLGKPARTPVVMTTSVNPGGGKTFITSNTALCFAVRNKRVVMVDLDMRQATLSQLVDSPQKGVSHWLSGRVTDLAEITVQNAFSPGLDVIPVGTVPPNPTELLQEDSLPRLFEALRQAYDYIFVDVPPVELVADTSLINPHVDLTLFVVRARLLEKALLPQVERYYREQSLRRMNLVLNGTRETYARYGSRRYGHGEGYRYGYRTK